LFLDFRSAELRARIVDRAGVTASEASGDDPEYFMFT
jgi:hypothetical protein